MWKLISEFTAWILPFLFIFGNRIDDIITSEYSINIGFVLLVVFVIIVRRRKKAKEVAKYEEGDPRTNYFNISGIIMKYGIGALLIYYISNFLMPLPYILMIFMLCFILSELMLVTHYSKERSKQIK